MCGCRGGITHYTLPSARCAPRDTPGPRMRLCPSLKSGLRRRFCRLTCTVSVAAKTPPKGRGRWTKDGADWPVTIKFLLPNGHKNSTCPKADAIINANRMLTVIQKTCRKAAFHQSLETSGLQPANAHGARACSVFRRSGMRTKINKGKSLPTTRNPLVATPCGFEFRRRCKVPITAAWFDDQLVTSRSGLIFLSSYAYF